MAAVINERSVLLITNIPTPYRIPLFNELSKQLEEYGLKLKVLFGAMGYERRQWIIEMSDCNFQYQVLQSRSIGYSDREKRSFTYSGLANIITKDAPVVIISNAFSFATMQLWLRSFLKDTPYIIWSGAIERNDKPASILRTIQRKMMIRRARGFIAYGRKAKEYLVALGASRGKIEIGINTVETEFFQNETHAIRLSKKSSAIKHLLSIGHLSYRKNLIKLIKVIKTLSDKRQDFILDIIGDGEDRDHLEKYVTANKMSNFVAFHGFKQKAEIPFYMAQSDCFLFQTDFDIWGLVLLEAMAAGLPCISSVHAGATQDLIEDGITGFSMDFSDVINVSEKIDWLLNNPEIASEIGIKANNFVQSECNLRKSAEGFVRAIITCHHRPGREP